MKEFSSNTMKALQYIMNQLGLSEDNAVSEAIHTYAHELKLNEADKRAWYVQGKRLRFNTQRFNQALKDLEAQ